MIKSTFNNLHVHNTHDSLLDSIAKVKDIVKFAKDNKQKAVALTDHGYMSQIPNLFKECKKQGIKGIAGVEAYEVDDLSFRENSKDYKQPRYHLVLFAKNQEGLENLYKITSKSFVEDFYVKPRINIQHIKDMGWNKGIICCTACQGGRLSRYLVDGEITKAKDYYDLLEATFEHVYVELQSHGTESQTIANKVIMEFAIQHNKPYVITTDAHMVHAEQMKSHSMFVAIGESREVGESYQDCHLQTEDDVFRILEKQFTWKQIYEGIKTTDEIVNLVSDDIDVGLDNPNMLPKINVPVEYEKDHTAYLRYLVELEFDNKFKHMSEKEQRIRRERIDMEIPILDKVQYIDYFIMCYMLIKEAKKRNIPLGYARGSASASICLFLLNVTQIDPVTWTLDFSRFANLGRTSLADVDIDISKRRRGEMIQIAIELFGKDNVFPISTFNTLSTKVAIRDIGKVMNEKEDSPYYNKIPYSVRDSIAKLIPTIKKKNDVGEEIEIEVALSNAMQSNDKLQKIYDEFPLWFKYVMDLEGLPKSRGQHASAVMITPVPAVKYSPLCKNKDGDSILQMEMHSLMDDMKLIKMDFLGLETLDIIDDTLSISGITWDDVDINKIDLADKEVYDNVLKNGRTIAVFQMESQEGRKMNAQTQTSHIEDIIAINAFNRPGTKDGFPTYCKNKLGGEIELVHPDLEPIFRQSQGVLLYQEQALQIFRYAGFPEDEVDNARRCIDENSLITMWDGHKKKIKDINIGDEVLSCNNKGSIRYKNVVNVFDNGMATVYQLISEFGHTIKATSEHKFLTPYGWEKLKNINTNTFIAIPNGGYVGFVCVKSIVKLKEKHHVYDIEVEDNHNYVAENIIVHNCIGHKYEEEMAKLSVKFKEGLYNKGWADSQIETIWSLMAKQATYSFNRAHAVAYGLLAYLTAYLKAHYTLEFMTACLIAKSNTAKLSLYINEAKEVGIDVCPPDINKSAYEFTCIKEQNKILFGLLAIKGLGQNAIDEIISMRPYKNTNDFITKINSSSLVVTLVKAGAVPTKNKREFLIDYAKTIFNKSPFKKVTSVTNLKDIKVRYNLDLYDIKDKEERLRLLNIVKEKEYKKRLQEKYILHMDKFAEKNLQDEYMWEFQTLSMFITNDPLKESYQYVTEWDNIEEGVNGVLLCVVTRVQRKKDRNGNTFAYVDLYTPFGIIESTCWSSQFNLYENLIVKGNSLAMLCKKRDGQAFIVECKPYKQWIQDREIDIVL